MTLHRPHGSLADGTDPVALDPDDAGWSFTGLRVLSLAPGVERSISTGDSEACLLPLSATAVSVQCDDEQYVLAGRSSVFARVTDFAYIPRDAAVSVVSPSGGEVALATARCDRRLVPRYGPAEDVAVEIRGAGPATRQVTNFMSPEVWEHADKLMCVELLTPDGNWSSYPPHRHDDSPECPVNNEEIYYFRIGRAGGTEFSSDGFGMHRTYTPDGSID
ncbi:MAG TPA: 5-deoxy-glucuronate isomerase, partial [Ilumatobacteraceae bacterium]|nr:5-deoxy-glucuronate isomerase [Ilumatobacteraceae bacterium]